MPKRLSAAERDARYAQVISLRRARVPFEKIGQQLDPKVSGPRAYQIYQEALAHNPLTAAQVDMHRVEALEMVDLCVRRLLTLATSQLSSPRIQVDALNALRAWEEHKARITNTYAPTKHEILTIDAIDAKIRALEIELGTMPERDGEGEPDALDAEIRELEAQLAGVAETQPPTAPPGASS
jgi:hypothetical protein